MTRARRLISLRNIQQGERLYYVNRNDSSLAGYVVIDKFGREFAHTLCQKKFRISNAVEQDVKGFSGMLWLSEEHYKSTL